MTLTKAEQEALEAVRELNAKWPQSLSIFSRNGNLVVLKPGDGRTFDEAEVFHANRIPNDGGDPDGWDEAH